MRFEYKYIVSVKYLESLRRSIMPFVEADPFTDADSNNQYTVRSIYFDTPNYDYYFEKIDGIKNRKKIRIRGYDECQDDKTVFLEIKRKYDIPIIKFRTAVQFDDAKDIFRKGAINGHILHEIPNKFGYENSTRFFFQVYSRNLRPVVLVVYDREAYFSKFDQTVRITLDKDLRGEAYPAFDGLFDDDRLRPALPGRFILEVKFNNHFPGWLNPIISKYGLQKRSASKYVITMDACRVINRLGKSALFTRSKWYN